MGNSEYYTFYIIACIAFSLVINILLLKFLKSPGIKNQETLVAQRWSGTSKPTVGGISFYVIFLFSLVFSSVWSSEESSFQELGILISATVAFIAGLADDSFNTRPLLKLISQISCAIILIYSGLYIRIFSYEWLNYLITIFWVVGVMNSINMLDNMDGITTVVSIFIILFFIVSVAFNGEIFSSQMIMWTGVVSALIGFLILNWHPSKIFMGDTGSQFLGLLLAAGAIQYSWNIGIDSPLTSFDWRRIFIPILVFLLPLVDTATVSINRLSHGQSPMVGGRDHTTHNLSYLGLRDNFVALIFTIIAMINTTLALFLTFITSFTIFWTIVCGLYILTIFLSLFIITRYNLNRKKFSYKP